MVTENFIMNRGSPHFHSTNGNTMFFRIKMRHINKTARETIKKIYSCMMHTIYVI